MTQNELDLLRSSMLQADRYIEYGAGNSTRMAVRFPNLTVIRSVESDRKFVDEHVRTDADVLAAEHSGRVAFSFVDIGPTREWGHPRDRSKSHLWPHYALVPYIERSDWSLILIDGRFRVACALLACLEVSSEAVILVHDFWWRPEYTAMLHFMDVTRKADALVQLRRRSDFNSAQAQKALQQYFFAPDDRVQIPLIRRSISALSRRSSRIFSNIRG